MFLSLPPSIDRIYLVNSLRVVVLNLSSKITKKTKNKKSKPQKRSKVYLTVGQVMVFKQCTARTNALVNETVIHSFNHLFSLFHSINSMCSYLAENKGCLIFSDGSDHKASAYNAGDLGSIPGSGRYPGEGNGNPLQYSCLEKSHGQRSLVVNSPWGHKEPDTTE